MIQNIEPYKYKVEYRNITPEGNDYVVVVKDNRMMVGQHSDECTFPTWQIVSKCDATGIADAVIRYLFEIEGAGRFLLLETGMNAVFEELSENGWISKNQDEIQEIMPRWAAFAGTTAFQFARWYENNRFCGKCGSPMVHSDRERMVHCSECRNSVYPRINPVVIVGVINGNRILLTKYARGDYKLYALVAGFAEAGESIEDAARREVLEETGVKIKNIRFYKSQPWSISDSLIMGFFCELDGSETVHLDDGELSTAEWVERENVPEYGDDISVTGDMMRAFRNSLV